MDTPTICPVCKNPVEVGSNECQRCGFRLVGGTQEIEPLNPEATEVHTSSLCTKPHLIVTKGPLEGEVFELEPLPVTIGREPSCDFFLNNMTVSRQHAVIERRGKHIMIRDCGSLNGTWVDGKVTEEAELKEGTRVQIGTFLMQFACG